jgi:hypothetical protein
MSLFDKVYDIALMAISELQVLKLRILKSDGLKPLTILHQSGAKIELKSDGKAYYNGTEINSGSASTIHTVEKVKGVSSTDLTFEVDSGQSFVFKKV